MEHRAKKLTKPQLNDLLDFKIPEGLEAERALLGAILLSPELISEAMPILKPEQLFYESHREIYDAMLAITRRGQFIDPITISDELRARQTADMVGGNAYVASLIDGSIASQTLKPYLERILGYFFDRELLRVSKEIAYIAVNRKGESVRDSVARARACLDTLVAQYEIHGLTPAATVVEMAYKLAEMPPDRARARWGYPDLDRTTGGLYRGNLTVVAARTSVGKSAFAATVLRNLAKQGRNTCLFTLEMEREEVQQRLISMEARIPLHVVKDGQEAMDKEQMGRYIVQIERMKEWPYWIDASPVLTLSDIRAKVARLQQGLQIDVIILDYLQLLKPEGRYPSRREAVDEIARGLKQLARELNVSLIALAQLSRAVESRSDHRPTLADLRESGEIEQSADNVLFLYRPGLYDETIDRNLTEIIVAKQRNGPTETSNVVFLPEFTCFESIYEGWR